MFLNIPTIFGYMSKLMFDNFPKGQKFLAVFSCESYNFLKCFMAFSQELTTRIVHLEIFFNFRFVFRKNKTDLMKFALSHSVKEKCWLIIGTARQDDSTFVKVPSHPPLVIEPMSFYGKTEYSDNKCIIIILYYILQELLQ